MHQFDIGKTNVAVEQLLEATVVVTARRARHRAGPGAPAQP
jgi:hypothetical protein